MVPIVFWGVHTFLLAIKALRPEYRSTGVFAATLRRRVCASIFGIRPAVFRRAYGQVGYSFISNWAIHKSLVVDEAPTIVNSSVRAREYLTAAEVERLQAAARKFSRWGHRDATMILLGYRHGLRASELCDLRWSQVELATGRLHVRRTKNGTPSVHPLRGEELRALRRLQRECGPSPYVFQSERGGPMTPKSFHALFGRSRRDHDTARLPPRPAGVGAV